MTPPSRRLHVLLAKKAPIGLVLRKGTANTVCTLLWNRRTDKFTLGQWMRGQIAVDTCNLSPDGEHFVYSGWKYSHAVSDRVFWTVVSRTPYLKGVAYYGRRCGGGWFFNNGDYCVPGGTDTPDDRESPEVRRVHAESPKPFPYAARLLSAGWTIPDVVSRAETRTEFVRPVGQGWNLRHSFDAGYKLTCGELVADTRNWDWADLDANRLVWAAKDGIWTGKITKQGIEETRRLHDFSAMEFEAIAAPYDGGNPVRSKPPTHQAPGAPRPPDKKPKAPAPRKPNRSKVRPGQED